MTKIERIIVPDLPPPVSHYCHVTRAGSHVWVSGVVGQAQDGSIPSDVVAQFDLATAAMDKCLRAAGAGPEHVVKVQVFMDRNGNQSPDAGEWIDAMTVLLTTSGNDQIQQRTQNGIAIFDLSGYTPGIVINVSLPGLYRSESLELPVQGEVTITFMFEQPALPTSLP